MIYQPIWLPASCRRSIVYNNDYLVSYHCLLIWLNMHCSRRSIVYNNDYLVSYHCVLIWLNMHWSRRSIVYNNDYLVSYHCVLIWLNMHCSRLFWSIALSFIFLYDIKFLRLRCFSVIFGRQWIKSHHLSSVFIC